MAIKIVSFPIKVVIFHSYVSSPEGNFLEDPYKQWTNHGHIVGKHIENYDMVNSLMEFLLGNTLMENFPASHVLTTAVFITILLLGHGCIPGVPALMGVDFCRTHSIE